MKPKYILLLAISGFVVSLDQLTKLYVHTHFRLGESLPVIENIFHITYVRNFGAAFGIFADSPPFFREFFFLTVPPFALIVILAMMRSVPDRDRIQIIALCLVFGGAIGNYIDRLRFRYVIDFLDFHYKDVFTYPAFNVADMAIVGGVGFLLYVLIRDSLEERRKSKEQEVAS